MIEINFSKWADFFFIVVSAFVVAMAGNYFFQWDFQFGLLVGIVLGVWNSLYDMIAYTVSFFEEAEERMEQQANSQPKQPEPKQTVEDEELDENLP